MSTPIRIACAPSAKGQFVQLALMPKGTPELLVGDRAWVRLLRNGPDSQLHVIEAWGESPAIVSGELVVVPGEEDLAQVLFPGMEDFLNGCLHATFDQPGGTPGVGGHGSCSAGERIAMTFQTSRVKLELEAFVAWRAPWAHVSVAGMRLEDTADELVVSVHIPGWTSINVPIGLIGQVTQCTAIVHAPRVTGEVEEVWRAHNNAELFRRHAIAAQWRGDFLGWPITESPWTVEQARTMAPALRAQPNPNQTGIHGFYSVSLAPLLWCQDGVCRENLDVIIDVAGQWLDRQATWLLRDGTALAPWPVRSRLTVHNSKPWIDDRSDPYDDLGYGKPRGSHWTADALIEHDDQHENCELLAVAARATLGPAFRLAAHAKLAALTYQRAWVGHLDGSWPMPPQGRTAARPGLALLALAGLSDDAHAIAHRVSETWIGAMLRGIQSRRIPRAMPVQVAGTQPGPLFAGYEEGLVGLFALRQWRMFGDARALEVAYLCGRTVATTIYWFLEAGQTRLAAGYEIAFRGDGRPQMPSEGGIVLAGRDLATWSVGGLNALMAARVAMQWAGIAGEADDQTWIEIASRAREELTSDLALDSPAQAIVRVNQTLWRARVDQLATREELAA